MGVLDDDPGAPSSWLPATAVLADRDHPPAAASGVAPAPAGAAAAEAAERWTPQAATPARSGDAGPWLPDLPSVPDPLRAPDPGAVDLDAWRATPSTTVAASPAHPVPGAPRATSRRRLALAAAAVTVLAVPGVLAASGAFSGGEDARPAAAPSTVADLDLPIAADAATVRRLADRIARLQGTERREAARRSAARRKARAAARRRSRPARAAATTAAPPAAAAAVVAPPPPPVVAPRPQAAVTPPRRVTPSRPTTPAVAPKPQVVAPAAPAPSQPIGAAPDDSPGRTGTTTP